MKKFKSLLFTTSLPPCSSSSNVNSKGALTKVFPLSKKTNSLTAMFKKYDENLTYKDLIAKHKTTE